MVASEPAFTVAGAVTVSTTSSCAVAQGPEGSLVVNRKVTVPVLPAIGVKVTVAGVVVAAVLLNWLVALVMLPVTPTMLHVPLLAAPPMEEPVRVYAEPEHIVASVPALAVAVAFTVSTISSLTAGQVPAGSLVVRRKVTVPVLPAMGVKVIVAGVAVAAVLLNCEVAFVIVPVTLAMLHDPLDAPPPIEEPVNV